MVGGSRFNFIGKTGDSVMEPPFAAKVVGESIVPSSRPCEIIVDLTLVTVRPPVKGFFNLTWTCEISSETPVLLRTGGVAFSDVFQRGGIEYVLFNEAAVRKLLLRPGRVAVIFKLLKASRREGTCVLPS